MRYCFLAPKWTIFTSAMLTLKKLKAFRHHNSCLSHLSERTDQSFSHFAPPTFWRSSTHGDLSKTQNLHLQPKPSPTINVKACEIPAIPLPEHFGKCNFGIEYTLHGPDLVPPPPSQTCGGAAGQYEMVMSSAQFKKSSVFLALSHCAPNWNGNRNKLNAPKLFIYFV